MIKYIFLFCLLCYSTENWGKQIKNLEFKHVTLENKYLKLQFLPASMGRLSRLELKPKGINLLREYKAIQTARSPLFCPISDNSAGIRELYWGKGIMGSTAPMKITSRSKNSLSLFARHYANTKSSLNRTISIIPGSTIIQFKTSITANSPQKQKIAVWLNIIPSTAAKNTPLIPAKGGMNKANNRKVFFNKNDSIISGSLGGSYIAPARPWLATAYPGPGIIMALVFPEKQLLPDGFFYTWQGNSCGKKIKTIEAIMAKKCIAPGSSLKINYKIMIFQGLNSIDEISNNCGIKAQIIQNDKSHKILFTLSPAAPIPACKLNVYLKSAKYKIPLNSFNIKKLLPGQIQTISYVVNNQAIPPSIYQIAGEWSNGNTFTLINSQIIRVK